MRDCRGRRKEHNNTAGSPAQNIYIRRVREAENFPNRLEELFAEWMERPVQHEQPNITIANRILGRFLQKGDAPGAERFFTKITEHYQLTPDTFTFSNYLESLARQGRISLLQTVLTELEERPRESNLPNQIHYCILLNAYTKNGNAAMAIDTFQRMQKRGISPDVVTYNSVLMAIAPDGNLEQMQELIQKMRADGMKLDHFTYCALIKCFAVRGEFERSFTLLQEALSVLPKNKVLEVFNKYIVGLSDGKHLDQVEDAIQLMKEHNIVWNSYTYNVIMDIYGTAGKMDKVSEYQKLMSDAGFQPDSYTFSSVIKSHSNKSDTEDTLEIIRSLNSSPATQSTVVSVLSKKLNSLAKAGKVQEALSLFEEARQHPQLRTTTSIYNALLNAMIFRKMENGMNDLYQALLDDIHSEPDRVTFNLMIKAFGNMRQVAKIDEVRDTMRSRGIASDVNTFNSLLFAYGKCGSTERIPDLFSEFQREGVVPNTKTFNTALATVSKVQDVESFGSLMHQMAENKVTMDSFTYSIIINFVLKHSPDQLSSIKHLPFPQIHSLEIARALRTEALEKGLKHERVFTPILAKFASTKNISDLLNEVQFMRDNKVPIGIATYNNLISGYTRTGDFAKAEAQLDIMKNRRITPDSRSFMPFLLYYCRKGDMELAEYWFERMKKETKADPDRHALLLLKDGYTVSHDSEGLERVHSLMARYGYKPLAH